MFSFNKIVRGFAFMPERSKRFFTLRIHLKQEIPLSGMACIMQRRSLKNMRNG